MAKINEVIFGGGRLKTNVSEIPLDYAEFLKVYEGAKNTAPNTHKTVRKSKTKNDTPSEETPESAAENAPSPEEPKAQDTPHSPAEPELPKTRTRKSR